MDAWIFKVSVSLLLAYLDATLATSGEEGHEQARLHAAWCRRVCPSEAPSPSPERGRDGGAGASSSCPEVHCPQPVCPQPVCPSLPAPPACPPPPPAPPCFPQTPALHSASASALPWNALQTYNSTYLGYYKFYHKESLSWFDAQMHCERDGAHLLVLNSEEEDELVRRSMNTAKKGWLHVGVHDLIREGMFTTVQGRPLSTTGFEKWLPGHPKVNIESNCAWIKRSDSGLGMGPCSDKGSFICEVSLE